MYTNNTVEEINKVIKTFIFEQYLFCFNENKIGNDSSLLELGVLDSTGIIEIVALVEHKYNITVFDNEITPENFDTINNISKYVSSKISNIEG